MSGHVGDLSPEQEEALEKVSSVLAMGLQRNHPLLIARLPAPPSYMYQLRAAVSGLPLPEDDDYFFLRWLRARSFNVDKAEEMLRKVHRLSCNSARAGYQPPLSSQHLDIRREMGADTILQDYTPPEVEKHRE